MNPETAIYMVQVAESFATFAYALAFGTALILGFVLGIEIMFRYDREEAAAETEANVRYDLGASAALMGLEAEAIAIGWRLVAQVEKSRTIPSLRRREFSKLADKNPTRLALAIKLAFREYSF